MINNNIHNSTTRLILNWDYFGIGDYAFDKLNEETLTEAGCPVTNCLLTDDLDLFNQSQVVIFFAQYIYDLPVYRFPHQNFVFFDVESPMSANSPVYRSRYTRYNFFNRTMTYRRDSDIVQLNLYGKVRPKISSKNQYIKSIIKKKTKLVAWFASHCETPIQREEYVRQLNQFIPVDIYGKCGNMSCSHQLWVLSKDCNEMLRRDYKFYIAFENSWCADYVTEKFYRPLYYDTVPIVMGGADYHLIAPPNSFINVKDFKSPKDLAEYLLKLDQSDDLYERYFDWKREFEVDLHPMDGWCELCKLANGYSHPAEKVYGDIRRWWIEEAHCKTNLSSILQ